MTHAIGLAAPTTPVPPDELANTLLDVALAGFILFRPVCDAQSGAIVDFTYEHLNPAAQRMLRMPAQPAGSLLVEFPTAAQAGVLDFYRHAFLSGERARHQFNLHRNGVEENFYLVAQRQGERLVVSFTDASQQSRSVVEDALHDSQAREQAARQQTERQQQDVNQFFEQAPVAISLLRGPEHLVELMNATNAALLGSTPDKLLGRPIMEALPVLRGQGFDKVLARVLGGETIVFKEVAVTLDRAHLGKADLGYYHVTYQPWRAEGEEVIGAMTIAVEVTEQVQARQQLEQLNQELEARVQRRTQQVQEALAAAERQRTRLAQLIMEAPAAICVFAGPDLVYELVNPRYQALFPRRSRIGRPLLEVLPALTDHPIWHSLREVYETGRTQQRERMMYEAARPGNGALEKRYFTYTLQARHDEHGQINGILVFAYEVTEQEHARQQAEALQAQVLAATQRQVQEREAFFQLLEQAPTPICILRGPELRYEYANNAYRQLLPGCDLQGRRHIDVLPESEGQYFVVMMNDCYRTGETYYGFEMPFVFEPVPGRPGRVGYFNFTCSAYRDRGQIVGISIFAHEVTELVHAKQQREAHRQQLQRIFAQVPVSMTILSGPCFVVEMANTSTEAILGLPAATLLGRPFFEALPEATGQGIEAVLAQVLATGEPLTMQEVPLAGVEASGEPSTRYYNCSYQLLHDERSKPTSILCIAVEVTEQVLARQQVQRLNNELTTANQQLTRTNVDLDNFIYTASHDLRQPISNIEGLLRLLENALPDASRNIVLVAKSLAHMRASIERFKRTIANLTEVSKLQLEFAQPAVPVRLDAIIEDVRQDLLPLLTATGGQLEVAVDGCQPRVFSEKNLRSIVYNLLSNALKYCHPERPPLVRIGCATEGDCILLKVQDNGLGMNEPQQARLFQLFQRMHTHVEGSGLGLYMVKKIVENAGGTIGVESQVAVGTTFLVRFPA
jgi:PAS domain S-box-containing protein